SCSVRAPSPSTRHSRWASSPYGGRAARRATSSSPTTTTPPTRTRTREAAMTDAAEQEAPRYEAVPDDVMPREHLAALEAILMVVDEPVPAAQLASVLGLPTGQVTELLGELAADYAGERGGRPRGFELRELAGGWRVYSAPA